MVVIAVKKRCRKGHKQYGPYPKAPDQYYLYEVYRQGGRVKHRYLGRGAKNREPVVQEPKPEHEPKEALCIECQNLHQSEVFCSFLSAFLDESLLDQPWLCEGFQPKGE